jgi:hypothetical protein
MPAQKIGLMIKKVNMIKRLYQVGQDAFSGMQITHHARILPKVLIPSEKKIDTKGQRVI